MINEGIPEAPPTFATGNGSESRAQNKIISSRKSLKFTLMAEAQ